MIPSIQTDIVIIGAGHAGLAAAVSAAESNREVVVVCRDYASSHGSDLLNAIDPKRQSQQFIDDSAEQFITDILQTGEYRNNRDLVEVMAYGSNALLNWLADQGVLFEDHIFYVKDSMWARSHRLKLGTKEDYITVLRRNATKMGVRFLTGCDLSRLAIGDEPRKNGYLAQVLARRLSDKADILLQARLGCIVATGGFAGNDLLVRQADRRLSRIHSAPWLSPKAGIGLQVLKRLGAASTGLSAFDLACTDISCEKLLGSPESFLLVDNRGLRFVAEDTDMKQLLRSIARHPIPSWIITDALGVRDLFLRQGYESLPAGTCKAVSFAELSQRTGINFAALDRTIKDYTASVRTKKDFPPPVAKLKKTLLRPIEKPPFYAVPVEIQIQASLGGVAINRNAQVLNWQGAPIAGLYAAGDVTGGIHGSFQLPGNRLLSALLFGRIAGRSAAINTRFPHR